MWCLCGGSGYVFINIKVTKRLQFGRMRPLERDVDEYAIQWQVQFFHSLVADRRLRSRKRFHRFTAATPPTGPCHPPTTNMSPAEPPLECSATNIKLKLLLLCSDFELLQQKFLCASFHVCLPHIYATCGCLVWKPHCG